MNSKILNISPDIDRGDGKNMCEAIRLGEKQQSIRSYPIPAETTLHIWAKKRGMKKGWYCDNCHKRNTLVPLLNNPRNRETCKCGGEFIHLPEKLLKTTALEPIPIEMCYFDFLNSIEVSVLGWDVFKMKLKNKWGNPHIGCDDYYNAQSLERELWVIGGNKPLHPFAKADNFITNGAMIDFFSKHLKSGWNQMYINRWKYPGVEK